MLSFLRQLAGVSPSQGRSWSLPTGNRHTSVAAAPAMVEACSPHAKQVQFTQLALHRGDKMMRKVVRWARRHRVLSLCSLLLAVAFVLNVVAFNHAWSMTHFASDGSRTASPESLSLAQKVAV